MNGVVFGWQAVQPGPPPCSPLLDNPPASGDPAAHRSWRSKVELDERRIAAQQARQPVWYPIPATGNAHVVPVFGGTPDMWRALLACLAASATSQGFARARMVNLVPADAFGMIRQMAPPLGTRSDVLSSRGSTFDVFANLTPDELTSIIADVLRQNPQEARRARRELARIAALLTGNVGIVRLCDAVALTLGRNQQSLSSVFSSHEGRRLRDHRADVVTQQAPVATLLSELHSELEELIAYRHDRNRAPGRYGRAGLTVRTISVDVSGGVPERRLGCELLARAVMRSFNTDTSGNDLLVVVGAEFLATEVLAALTGAAQRDGKQLVLLFGRITEDAHNTLGHGGGDCAVFLRLPNSSDATKAADYLGRQFTFVVNGISIAQGETDQWTQTQGSSTTYTSGTSHTSTSNQSLGLKAALSIGHSFGNTVSSSFASGSSRSSTTGGSHQTTSTVSHGRVYEHVVPPEVFQQLADDAMLVVRRRTVVLAHCDPAIARSGLVSAVPWAP